MKDFYGLQEGIVGYFGIGIKYDAAPAKKTQKTAQDTESPAMQAPADGNMPMTPESTMPMHSDAQL